MAVLKQFWVSEIGSDTTGDGSEGAPYATPQYALNNHADLQNQAPGNLMWIEGNVETPPLDVTGAQLGIGTAGTSLTFAGKDTASQLSFTGGTGLAFTPAPSQVGNIHFWRLKIPSTSFAAGVEFLGSSALNLVGFQECDIDFGNLENAVLHRSTNSSSVLSINKNIIRNIHVTGNAPGNGYWWRQTAYMTIRQNYFQNLRAIGSGIVIGQSQLFVERNIFELTSDSTGDSSACIFWSNGDMGYFGYNTAYQQGTPGTKVRLFRTSSNAHEKWLFEGNYLENCGGIRFGLTNSTPVHTPYHLEFENNHHFGLSTSLPDYNNPSAAIVTGPLVSNGTVDALSESMLVDPANGDFRPKPNWADLVGATNIGTYESPLNRLTGDDGKILCPGALSPDSGGSGGYIPRLRS